MSIGAYLLEKIFYRILKFSEYWIVTVKNNIFLQKTPEALDQVEIWRIRRQVDHIDPACIQPFPQFISHVIAFAEYSTAKRSCTQPATAFALR